MVSPFPWNEVNLFTEEVNSPYKVKLAHTRHNITDYLQYILYLKNQKKRSFISQCLGKCLYLEDFKNLNNIY